MRILHAIHSLNPAHGGTTYGLRGLVECLLKRQHETAVLVLDDPDSPWLGEWPCPIHAVGKGWGTYGYNPRFAALANQLVTEFDWIIIHGLWQYHGAATRRACRSSGTPYAVFPHGMLDPWFARAYRAKHLRKQFYWWLVEYRVLRDACVTFFTTKAELEAGKQTFWPFQVLPAIAPFGVAPPRRPASAYREEFRRRHPSLAQRRLLLFMGRLHHKKGCDILIEGYARWRATLDVTERAQWQLRLVGPQEDERFFEELQALADRHGLRDSGALVFVEPVKGDEKWEELAIADALILPSHQENFGVVIAEALACGTPALISDKVNGWTDIVNNGAGLAEADTLPGVTELLHRWAAQTEQERAEMRQAAMRFFDRAMSADVSMDAVIRGLQKSSYS